MADFVGEIPEINQIQTSPKEIEIQALNETINAFTTSQTETKESIDKLNENLTEQQKEDNIEKEKSFKFFENMQTKFDNISEGIGKVFNENKEVLVSSLLGPMNLIVKPFEEFTGGSLTEGLTTLFKPKKSKLKPTADDVAKTGDAGTLFIWHKLQSLFGKKKEEDEGSFFDKLQGMEGAGGIAGALMKAGAVAMILGGLAWGVAHGIKAMGMKDAWGVSKGSAFLGGFLGGTESGWTGAFKNLGKWALIGAGIGFLAGGPVGAIIGGLVGAAIGAVLGFIGGETIAKGIENTKNALLEIWNDESGNTFTKIGKSIIFVMDTMGNAFAEFFATIPVMIASLFTKDENKLAKIKTFFKEVFLITYELLFNPVAIVRRITNGAKQLKNWVKKQISERLKPFFKGIITGTVDTVENFFVNMSSNISTGLVNVGDFFRNIWDNISQGFFNMISNAGDVAVDTGMFFQNLWLNVSGWVQDKIFTPLQDVFTRLGEHFGVMGDILSSDARLDQRLADIVTYTTGIGTEASKERLEQILLDREGREDLSNTVDFNKTDSVNDAIIKADGTIIRTHEDDNLIATKNDPTQMMFSTGTPNGGSFSNEAIDLLMKILIELEKLNTKGDGNGSGNITNSDLSNLIGGGVF